MIYSLHLFRYLFIYFQKFPNLTIQAIIDYSDKDLFNKIQNFATIELKIQVIPVDSPNEVAQYLERFVCESYSYL